MSTTQHNGPRRGQVIVLAPIMIFTLGAMLALTADVGRVFVEGAKLQNAADAASLAAARVLLAERNEGSSESEARAAATAEAQAMGEINSPGATLDLAYGYMDGETFVAADTSTEASAVSVSAARDDDSAAGPVQTAFAALLGVAECDLYSGASAQVAGSVRGVRGGLSPFAVHEEDLAPIGEEMTFYPGGEGGGPGQGLGDDQTAPGNFGLLNLDGGACGVPELRDWILYGYDGEIVIGEDGYLWMDGTPGFRATLQSEMNQVIGQELIMVIFDQVTGTGSNANYRCVGFLVATILEAQLTGPNAHATCRVEGFRTRHDLVLGGSYSSPNIRKIQLVD